MKRLAKGGNTDEGELTMKIKVLGTGCADCVKVPGLWRRFSKHAA
jgi:hypothetical protein